MPKLKNPLKSEEESSQIMHLAQFLENMIYNVDSIVVIIHYKCKGVVNPFVIQGRDWFMLAEIPNFHWSGDSLSKILAIIVSEIHSIILSLGYFMYDFIHTALYSRPDSFDHLLIYTFFRNHTHTHTPLRTWCIHPFTNYGVAWLVALNDKWSYKL